MGHAAHDVHPAALSNDPRRGAPPPFEAEVVLTPAGRGGHPRARGLRVVGPGRREREYLGRIGDLERSLDDVTRTLDQAALVERGTGRLADRLELELEGARVTEQRAREQLHRTLVLLGATQREVEGLRARLAAADRRALGAPPAQGFWRRLLGKPRG